MAWEPKEGQGTLFKNTRKEQESHPDYKGDILIGGVRYWLSAWIKKGEKGAFMSLSARAKTADDAPKHAPAKKANPVDDMADDIPF